jgi:FkbM family methyltransferase
MKTFEVTDLLNHDLTPDSWVLEAGAFKGSFAAKARAKWDCHVLCFEPIDGFFQDLRKRFAKDPKVLMVHAALGPVMQQGVKFRVKGDMSGQWTHEGKEEPCIMVTLDWAIAALPVVDLANINIEGGEYDLLEDMLRKSLAKRFKFIQVQFHNLPQAAHLARWEAIRWGLEKTHQLAFGCPPTEFLSNTWEGWSLR